MKAGTLILLCGLPGAGKSVLAKKLAVERRAIRMCPDEWIEKVLADPNDAFERDRLRDPVEDLQFDLAREYIALGFTIVLEFGFWSEEERSLYSMGALELGARIELYYLEASFDTLWERVQRRNSQLVTGPWVMTRDELEAAWRLFQAPTAEELEFYDEWRVIRE
ncbi:MAG TPA: ATP-binding protein [Fimbriimonadaceae bacterium]|nr:ATP-binding protein [Fimbriimonadaceae bacterium]